MVTKKMETASEVLEIVATPEQARQIAEAEAAHKRPVLISNGIMYELEHPAAEPRPSEERDIWVGYDPEAVRVSMRSAAGSWSDVDTEAIKEYIYAGRDAGTRPPDRP